MEKQAQLNKEAQQLRGLAGQINWVSSQTRHDMTYSACEVSVSTKNATIVDLTKANKNIQKLRSECLSLKIVNVEDTHLCTTVCFSDASFANFKDTSSQSGYIIFLYKNNKSFSPIAWKSRKIMRVVKSIL